MALPLILAFALLFILSVPNTTSGARNITTLPGYNGTLPFHLETGYVAVGENKEIQLFYYFAGSEKKGSEDPLLLWISGGPGCSSAAGFFFQHGPLSFVIDRDYDGTFPQLQLNDYRWTQLGLNILYVDAPVGSGFSYANTTDPPVNDDIHFVAHTYEFIQEWLKAHSNFRDTELYVGGDGYSGKPVAVVTSEILNGNGPGSHQPINLKGYVVGNPGTDDSFDRNAQITFANRIGIIPDALYKLAWDECEGDFTNDSSPDACRKVKADIWELLPNPQVNWIQILEPSCSNITNDPFPESSSETYIQLVTSETFEPRSDGGYEEQTKEPMVVPRLRCRNYGHKFLATWAHDAQVQAQLGVPEENVTNWQYCLPQGTIQNKNITSVLNYHKNFSANSTLRALIYSGDHDISIPHIATQKWIDTLNLTETLPWRAWSFEDNETEGENEIAGYTRSLNKNNYNLTFVLIKGGGHYAAETNVKQCHYMLSQWLAYSDL